MIRSADSSPGISPLLAIFFGLLAVSTAAIFIRFAQEFAPSLVIAAYRLSLATLAISPVALSRNRTELATLRGRRLGLALLSGLFLALHFASWITSLQYTTVASSVVLVSTSPLWVALLSPITIKEPIGRIVWVGMSLALVGGIVVGLSDSCAWNGLGLACPNLSDWIKGQAFLGDLLALVGALMGAVYLLIGRRLRAGTSLVSYVYIVYGVAAVVLVAFTVATRQALWGYPPQTYLWFILLALIPQLLGHSTFNWALRYLSAAYVSITLLGEPIGSTILAYLLLGETPTLLKIFGAILILAGIYVASKSET
jgi:drug/metabolite transporter (DMT)-like permease